MAAEKKDAHHAQGGALPEIKILPVDAERVRIWVSDPAAWEAFKANEAARVQAQMVGGVA